MPLDFDDMPTARHSLMVEATGFGKGLILFVSLLATVGFAYIVFLVLDRL